MRAPTEIILDDKSKHSDVGASKCERISECPGSVAAEALVPKKPASSYAEEGTAAHAYAASVLNDELKLGADVTHVIEGDVILRGKFSFEVTPEMDSFVRLYTEYVKRRSEERNTKIRIEQEVRIPSKRGQLFGTADSIIISPTILEVVDFKYGAGIKVYAKDNKQGLYYLTAAYRGLSDAHRSLIRTFKFTVIQPRCFTGNVIESAEYSLEEIEAFEQKLLALEELVFELSNADRETVEATFKAGDWCKFCRVNPGCPALRKEVQIQAKADFADFPAEVQKFPDPYTLTPEQRAIILAWRKPVVDYFESVFKYSEAKALSGKPEDQTPGYKVVMGYGDRAYTDEIALLDEFAAELESREEIAYSEPKLLSPSQLEQKLYEVLKEEAKETKTKITKKSIKERIDKFTTKPERGLAFVPESDARQSVTISAADDFIDVDVIEIRGE